MPHVEIKCYPGRTDEQKNKCAEEITRAITETLGCDASSVSVAIKEIEKEDWKDKVWDAQIVADDEFLYKKPGYTC
ncbi:MAG: tautomerase PptA [Lachnospiraceae bacterium]|nr:tautomerase PptA [Lachnospiraceae bacterium]